MNFFQRYRAYLNDNPKHYWFKRKLYGWGWIPATWQGWAVTGIFILLFTRTLVPFADNPYPSDSDISWFAIECLGLIVAFIIICLATGERPRFQWGLPKK